MGDSRGNATQSVQSMAGPKKMSRNGHRSSKQSRSQDEQSVSEIARLGRPGNIEAGEGGGQGCWSTDVRKVATFVTLRRVKILTLPRLERSNI